MNRTEAIEQIKELLDKSDQRVGELIFKVIGDICRPIDWDNIIYEKDGERKFNMEGFEEEHDKLRERCSNKLFNITDEELAEKLEEFLDGDE